MQMKTELRRRPVSGYAADMENAKPNVEQLVDDLIGTGVLDEDAISDLRQNYLELWRKGALDADDVVYLEAFHARILGLEQAVAESDGEEARSETLQVRLEAATARAERAEARVAELEQLLSERSNQGTL